MTTISSKVRERLIAGLKRYQPILQSSKTRDINESDTVTIVKDVLADLFGFDKYSEITSEYAIRGTFVDLAIKLDGQINTMVEVKAIGLELKDAFVKQAVDYAANQGVEWVILTNGALWHVYRVSFKQPIEQELVMRIDLLASNPKRDEDLYDLMLITREGLSKSLLNEYHAQRQALSRYFIGAMLLSDPVVDVLRRELRRMSPDVKIDSEQIREVMLQEVLKRDVVDGDRADEARRKISRYVARQQRRQNKESTAPKVDASESSVRDIDASVSE